MKKLLAVILFGVAFLGVIVLAVSVSLTGSGSVGQVSSWSVQESCTPNALGDSNGSVGSASVDAAATDDSVYAIDNGFELTDANLGSLSGQVIGSPVTGSKAKLDVKGGLGFLVADRTLDPVWRTNDNDLSFLNFGSGTGQVATTYAIAVDTFDDSIFVMSSGTADGVDRHRVIKYSSAGVYITEFGSQGSGNGQFAGSSGIAIDPADGSVYVGDGANYRVQKFTTSGGRTSYAYAAKVGAIGSADGQFGNTQPITLAVDSSGNLYATDRGNSRIQKFNSSLTFQAKVTLAGSAFSPYGIAFDGTEIAATSFSSFGPLNPGTVSFYNTSLVLQRTLTLTPPAGTNTGIGNIAFESDGSFWAQWFLAPFLVQYDSTGIELARWYSPFPAAVALSTNYAVAVNSGDDVHVLYRQSTLFAAFDGNYVTTFDFAPRTLSAAILEYMEACDPTLGGYTFSYTAAANPNVVFPGWSGDVWTNLKELCAAWGVEIALVGTVITVRDIAATTISLPNKTVPTVTPSNVSSGRQVNIVHQNPSAGGGIMYDAAVTGAVYSVDVGQTSQFTVRTANSPVSLSSMVPTDTLPVQPGQYYVIDSTGAAVSAVAWLSAGGSVSAAVGDGAGEIDFILKGPTLAIVGFTGPFTFATARGSDGVPTFSVTGNGVTTNRQILELLTGADESKTTKQVAFTVDSPFVDTLTRAYDRGGWASADVAGPNVEVTFSVPSESLAGFGLTPGAIFAYADSRYRIKDVTFGVVRTDITATRHVTIGEVDAVWAGQTLGTYDTFWAGKSAGNQTIKPLAR